MPDVLDRIADDIAQDHYATRQVMARRMSERAQDMWSTVSDAEIERQWLELLPRLTAEVTVAQAQSAALSEPYVRAITQVEGRALVPAALAGVASDGRVLRTLLFAPAPTMKARIALGTPPAVAALMAGRQLAMIVGTQVSDAGRVGDGVAIATRENVGYVRELRLPSCSRCVVLAGKWFEWNKGFQRHPRCDCFHRPATRDESMSSDRAKFDERAYFASLSEKEQDRVFTKAGAQAIRDGADMNQVVNARRGMTPAGTTFSGTTRRSASGVLNNAPSMPRRPRTTSDPGFFVTVDDAWVANYEASKRYVRPMPELIYKASTSRAEAIEQLRQHGFII